jgi:hypothetical protein
MFAVNSNLAGNPGFFFVKYGSISSAGQDPWVPVQLCLGFVFIPKLKEKVSVAILPHRDVVRTCESTLSIFFHEHVNYFQV